MTKKVMKLIDPDRGVMQCKVCGAIHTAMQKPNAGRFYRGAWQCHNGCKIEEKK